MEPVLWLQQKIKDIYEYCKLIVVRNWQLFNLTRFYALLLKNKNTILCCLPVVISIWAYVYINFVWSIDPFCNIDKYPFIYGLEFCDELVNIKISWWDILLSLVLTKGTFSGMYNDSEKIIMKQYGYWENEKHLLSRQNLKTIDTHAQQKLSLQICPFTNRTFNEFLKPTYEYYRKNNIAENEIQTFIWTMLEINPEPILLLALRNLSGPLIPKYYGNCGRLTVVQDCGRMLYHYQNAEWNIRANLSIQLLKLAQHFTYAYERYSFYWMDFSLYNFVVDENLNVRIIDFGETIVVNKLSRKLKENMYIIKLEADIVNNFAYYPKEVCEHRISDHNFFAICVEIFQPNDIFTKNLLHSSPSYKVEELIRECIMLKHHDNRADVAQELIVALTESIS